jgi:hypothetical protein
MKLTLSGKEFTLRCDMRALANAKKEAGIELGNLSDDVVEIGTLVYFMAQSGAKTADVPFKWTLDDFLGLIDLSDLESLGEAVAGMLDTGTAKKKATAKR